MSRCLRTTLGPTALLALLSLAPLGAHAEPAFSLALPGLERPVSVLTDELGVPHVYAKTDHDVFLVQGYLHARDRFFQMDANRRAASGTLAELTGSASDVIDDAGARLVGFRRAAERSYELLAPRELARAQAYADGVNLWLASHPLPPEYARLEVTSVPPWSVVDTLTLTLASAPWLLDLGQINETALFESYVTALGEEDGRLLYFEDLGRFAPWVPRATVPDALGASAAHARRTTRPLHAAAAASPAEVTRRPAQRVGGMGILARFERREPIPGSNAFGVAAAHSENGRPLVAVDGHRDLVAPAFDYEIHLVAVGDPVAGPLNVSGASVPGIPGIIEGWNGRVAFVATAASPDVSDVFRDQLVRADAACAARLCIRSEGELHPVEERFERYRLNVVGDGVPDNFRDATPTLAVLAPQAVHALSVPFRSFGPVLDVDDRSVLEEGEEADTTVLTLQYTGFHGVRAVKALLEAMRARNVFELRESFSLPFNVIAADADGNLIYFANGEVPLRTDLEAGAVEGLPPFLIRDGSGPNNWIPDPERSQGQQLPFRVIPREEMPYVVNPPAGFVVNCNEDPTGFVLDNDLLNQRRPSQPSAILYYGDRGTRGFRNGRVTDLLRERLAAGEKVSLDDLKRIQGDTHPLHAELLTPHLTAAFASAQRPGAPAELAALAADPRIAEAVGRLAAWDFSTPTGIPEGYDASDVDGMRDPVVSESEAAHSVAATLYGVWWIKLLKRFDATLAGLGLRAFRRGTALHHLLAQEPFTGIGASGVNFFPEPAGLAAEDRRDVLLLLALRDTLDSLAAQPYALAFGRSTNQDDYRWGKLHRMVFVHRLGRDASIPPAGGFVDLGARLPGVARDGTFDTVNTAPEAVLALPDAANDFVSSFGAVSRWVMSPLHPSAGGLAGFASLSGGSSGDPASPLYAVQLGSWLTADYHEMTTAKGEVNRRAVRMERFVPVRPGPAGSAD